MGRSRKGAWIEIRFSRNAEVRLAGRSRKGAWIEMCYATTCD